MRTDGTTQQSIKKEESSVGGGCCCCHHNSIVILLRLFCLLLQAAYKDGLLKMQGWVAQDAVGGHGGFGKRAVDGKDAGRQNYTTSVFFVSS